MKTKYEYDVVAQHEEGITTFVVGNREEARELKRFLKKENRNPKIVQRKFTLESQKEIR